MLGSLSYLADACCVGRRPRSAAAAVYDELVGWRGLVVQVGHLLAAHGAVDRYLGELAALLGHEREAEIHFEAALRLDESARHAGVARPQPAGVRPVPRPAGPARPTSSGRRRCSAAALATAERLGMAAVAAAGARGLDARRVDRSRRRAGRRRADRARGRRAGLVAEGRSNREIGTRLHISQHTAANHVRSILMKTECANRTEAAAWALRRGLSAGAQSPAASNAPGRSWSTRTITSAGMSLRRAASRIASSLSAS